MNEVERKYNVVESFNASSWNAFVRKKINLNDFEVGEAEKKHPDDIKEQRYQMISTWQRKGGRDATIEKLEELAGENYSSSHHVTVSSTSQLQVTSAVPGDTTNEQVYLDSGESKAFAGNEASDNKSRKDPLLLEHDFSSTSGTQSDNKITGKIKLKKIKSKSNYLNTASVVYRPVETACDKVDKVKVIHSLSKDFEASYSSDSTYRISGPKKGLVLILNNLFRDDKDDYREGSELDVQHMKELWEQMGCHLYLGKVHEEKTAKEMKKLLEKFSGSEGYSFLVIVIMSHGGVKKDSYHFSGKDKKVIKISEVKELFQNSKSINIPKFFILQLCRGDMVDKGVTYFTSDVESDGIKVTLLPTLSDMLFTYAAMDGYTALRTGEGSWFINAITNIFMKHAHEKHVADLLVMVQANMKRKTGKYDDGDACKAMSKHESSLTKNFFLFPGHPKKLNGI